MAVPESTLTTSNGRWQLRHLLRRLPPRRPTPPVRTIFITGLPDNVKDRELPNLLRWLPGYQASQVNFKGEKPMGFALFATAHQALAAKDALQNWVFDEESKSVLNTEMAKKNLFVKRGIVADSNAYDQCKRLRTGGDYSHAGYTSPSPFHPPPPPVWGHMGIWLHLLLMIHMEAIMFLQYRCPLLLLYLHPVVMYLSRHER